MINEITIITNVIESLLELIDEPLQVNIQYNHPGGYLVGHIKGENLSINVYSDGSFIVERMVITDENNKKTKWFI